MNIAKNNEVLKVFPTSSTLSSPFNFSITDPLGESLRTNWYILTLTLFLAPATLIAQSFNARESTRLSPSDYVYGSYGPATDHIFDQMAVVDLSADLGIGADCGRLNVGNTLRASLNNIFDEKYFQSMGRNILAASPMLLTCYLSPTWCSILKHSRLRASYLMKTRLSQCGMIDKYIDSRTEEFAQERQSCIRKEIDRSGGDFEAAMESCQNIWNRDLSNWAGVNRPKTPENRTIESSAKWAGATNRESRRVKKILTSMVGDTVVKHGKVSVDYGGQNKPATPRTYLTKLESGNYRKLCRDLLGRVDRSGGSTADINRLITDADLKNLSGDSDRHLIDRQTVASLAALPPRQRMLACRKLSDSISMTMFASDMSKTMDFMTATVSHNPHLPDNRKKEVERKRQALKDQIELTLSLNRHKNEPLNDVLLQINKSASRYRDVATRRALDDDESFRSDQATGSSLLNCSDGYLCGD